MKKIIKICCVIIVSAFVFVSSEKILAAELVSGNAYKAVFKIYTYYLDENDNFSLAKKGFGVITDEDGMAITNEHTVTVRDNSGVELQTFFKVCLTRQDPYKEPICNYTADLIGKDNSTDLALIKVKFPASYSGNYYNNFDYVKLHPRQANKGQRVYAYGYPEMAGDTIFGLVGEVDGTIVKNGLLMIQNSSLPLFGVAGGALINYEGELLGITSDISKGMGDALSVEAINSFKGKYAVQEVQVSSLQKKFDVFLKKLIDAKDQRKFTNEIPHLKLTWGKDQLFAADSMQNIGIYNNVEILTPVETTSINYIPWTPDFIKQFQHSVLVDDVNSFRDKILSFVASNSGKPKVDEQEFNPPDFKKTIMDHLDKFKDFGSPHRTVIKNKEITVVSPVHNDSWFYNLTWTPVGSVAGEDFLNNLIGRIKSGESCIDLGKTVISGKTGNKLGCSVSGQEFQIILVGSDNFLISIIYGYGKGNSGNRVVDLLFQNLIILDQPANFKPQLSQTQSKVEIKPELAQNQPDTSKPVETMPQVELETGIKEATSAFNSDQDESKIQAIKNLGRRFIGRILLRVEAKGEAWYLSPKTGQAHYLANGQAAYQIMREQGQGISNKDLAKIPVGFSDLSGADTDGDGLTDPLEQALGTDKEKADTDGDGHTDKAEIETGYDPLKAKARLVYNNGLTNRFRGRILLQVEARGEAWYINPKDGKRYFLGTAEDAYQVMRKQSMGIAERDFAKL